MAMDALQWEPVLISAASGVNPQKPNKNIWVAQQIFRPSSRVFFSFSEGQMHYAGDPGTEAFLYVDKAFFPEGLNLLSIELLNFSQALVDWSFEWVVERVDGTCSCLGPFDLIQMKRRMFALDAKIFSNISRLRFNNLGAVNKTSFSMGMLILGS
jgi:hypothetical protein